MSQEFREWGADWVSSEPGGNLRATPMENLHLKAVLVRDPWQRATSGMGSRLKIPHPAPHTHLIYLVLSRFGDPWRKQGISDLCLQQSPEQVSWHWFSQKWPPNANPLCLLFISLHPCLPWAAQAGTAGLCQNWDLPLETTSSLLAKWPEKCETLWFFTIKPIPEHMQVFSKDTLLWGALSGSFWCCVC